MQIFSPSPDPAYSAASLDDARVIKMATETAQLLSAAVRSQDPAFADRYDLYKFPPSGRELWEWAAEHRGNFGWLVAHGRAIAAELDLRELCPGKLLTPRHVIAHAAQFDPSGSSAPTRFVNRAVNEKHGLDFRHVADVHEAYRQYLQARWAIEEGRAKWTVRGKPAWAI